jgi:hypothetical protein
MYYLLNMKATYSPASPISPPYWTVVNHSDYLHNNRDNVVLKLAAIHLAMITANGLTLRHHRMGIAQPKAHCVCKPVLYCNHTFWIQVLLCILDKVLLWSLFPSHSSVVSLQLLRSICFSLFELFTHVCFCGIFLMLLHTKRDIIEEILLSKNIMALWVACLDPRHAPLNEATEGLAPNQHFPSSFWKQ